MTRENKKRLDEVHFLDQCKKYPNFPKDYHPPYKGKDNSTNGLTKCVVDFLNLSGHLAERINTQGQARVNRCISGSNRVLGITYTPTTGRKGRADISAKIVHKSLPFPIPVEIEIKFGKDRMSKEQKQYEIDIKNVNGVYWVVRTFDDFIRLYDSLISRVF
jgi:hypothetical protein